MTSSRLTILDVGHGNSAVLTSEGVTAVFDGGLGGSLIDFLRERGVKEVEYVLVSHADADHIAGLVGLLSSDEFIVRKIYLNPDASRTSKIWDDLKSVLKEARIKNGTTIFNGLSTTIPGRLAVGDYEIHVVAPTPDTALSGVGGANISGAKTSAHAINAVIRVVRGNESIALFPGDLDEAGLQEIENEKTSISANVLVFPHHGGLPGKDAVGFTSTLCKLVKPQVVLFSNGRGKHKTPRPEIVTTIREIVPSIYIACTQLSEWCASAPPKSTPTHLCPEPASGRERNHCCAGTIVIAPTLFSPNLNHHADFVYASAPTALCKKISLTK